MAIKSYHSKKVNEMRYQVYVNVRSRESSGGRVQRKVSEVKTLREAQKIERELLRQCEREIQSREALGETFGKVVEKWEEFQTQYRSHELNGTTRGDYVSGLKKHCAFWWRLPAKSITKTQILEVLNQMEAQGSSVSYRNKMKVMINRIFIFGIDHGLIEGLEKSPARGISLGRTEQKKPEILTQVEIRKLLEEAKKLDHPWYSVWAMALLTGMRNGELYALLWADIDWENKALSVTKSYNTRRREVKSTKSGDWRTVPISTELMVLLKELKLCAKSQPEVLPRLTGWNKGGQAKELRKFCEGIGLPSVKFHTLRACFATQLIRQGIAPIQVQKICGWKDLETMQRYVRLAGIEIDGVTEGLKVLPDSQAMAEAMHSFYGRELKKAK